MKLKWMFALIPALFIGGCAGHHFEARITIPKTFVFDFSPYRELFLMDFQASFEGIEFDYLETVRKLLGSELPLVLEREISLLTPEDYFPVPEENSTAGTLPEKLSAVLATVPGSLVIAGDIEVSVKKLSRIREVRERLARKKNVLVQIENWTVNCNIFFIDADKQEVVFSENYSESYQNENRMSPSFTFSLLMDRVYERLLRQLVRGRRIQDRIILNR